MSKDIYVIAVKRACRNQVPPDWQQKLGKTSGIEILSSNERLLQVRATEEVMAQIIAVHGQWLNIEKQILHKTQATPEYSLA